MSVQRYPLQWPLGWKRTPAHQRQPARFSRRETRTNTAGSYYRQSADLSIADAIARLMPELDLLGAADEVLSTNVPVRLDGLPRSGAANPDDPGAAVYFEMAGKPRCLACDRWLRVADNIAAIAAHIYAIRAVDRYGVGTMEQAFAGYAALPASSEEWWLVLGVGRDASEDEVDTAYRRLAREHHPDVGGDTNHMARLNAARDAARRSAVTR
jgi:hypothetical protein